MFRFHLSVRKKAGSIAIEPAQPDMKSSPQAQLPTFEEWSHPWSVPSSCGIAALEVQGRIDEKNPANY